MPAGPELIRRGLPLVQMVAKRLARRFRGIVSFEDLVGMGHVALIEIARSFDPSLSSYETYAASKLKWAMLDGVRRETHGRASAVRALAIIASERFGEGAEPEPDEPTTIEQDQEALRLLLRGKATAMAIALLAGPCDAALYDLERESPEARYQRAELGRLTRDAVRDLPERERQLVDRHYFNGEAFDAIARDLGVSKSWASRLHDRAIAMLAETLGGLAG